MLRLPKARTARQPSHRLSAWPTANDPLHASHPTAPEELRVLRLSPGAAGSPPRSRSADACRAARSSPAAPMGARDRCSGGDARPCGRSRTHRMGGLADRLAARRRASSLRPHMAADLRRRSGPQHRRSDLHRRCECRAGTRSLIGRASLAKLSSSRHPAGDGRWSSGVPRHPRRPHAVGAVKRTRLRAASSSPPPASS